LTKLDPATAAALRRPLAAENAKQAPQPPTPKVAHEPPEARLHPARIAA
jgi:hypothetical protein